MHIPENYLSPSTCAALGTAMLPFWIHAFKAAREELSPEKTPLLGAGAAFSFLIMMFNLPLPGGTSLHAVGAPLLAILLGPWNACLCLSVALAIQAFFFGDGGILALGANCFNMALVMPFSTYLLYRLFRGVNPSSRREGIALFASAYLAINLGALTTSLLLGVQPLLFHDAKGLPLYAPYPLSVTLPAMLIPHLLVGGTVEGLLTVLLVRFVEKAAPDLAYRGKSPFPSKPVYLFLALLVALCPLGLLASGTPWGEWDLQELKELLGFLPAGMAQGFKAFAPMPDYTIKGLSSIAGYFLSALAGTALLLAIFGAVRRFLETKHSV